RRLSPEELAAKLAAWESSARQKSVPWRPLTPAKFSSRRRATLRLLADRSLLVGGDRPNYDTYDVEFDTDLKGITALRLEVLPHPSLPDGGPGRARMFQRGDFLLSEIRVEAWPRERPDEAVEVAIRHGSHDYAAKERSAALTLDGEYDTGWSVKGRTGQPHAVVYELAAPLGFDGGTRFRVTLAQRYIHQMTIGRFRMSATTERPPVRASGFPAAIEAALLQPPAERDAEERATLRSYFLSVTPELADERRKIAELRQSMPRHPTTLVLRERDDRRATRIHLRGEFLREGDEVEPGVFDFLHPLPGATPRDRLALARWLVSRENPLVARVTVNRVWQAFFGQGLVTTPEDFGFQGALPSHPALLDWLAVEFMDAGWSLKAFHRLIATSATYRQSSRLRPELMEADPAGLLLARGPRLRLDAEMIRDGALRAAGRLSQRIGGPSVFPPQPDGVGRLAWGGFHWKTSSGDDRYRRGLYTYWKRTIPFPGATVFDAPTADTCCVRRQKSNTPLQALTLLNDPVYVEAARGLAARVLRETSSGPGSFERRLRRLFLLCLSRPPDERERERVHSFLLAQRRRLARDELEPRDIAGKVPEDLDAVELALWTLTSRVILNLDESITKE
ncbi:MAG: DUF1553 domain-containing protein, partial [Planctomycetota bacterium]|nr:DUF1553 domain-containing protein [Planctomycetota bacterium]